MKRGLVLAVMVFLVVVSALSVVYVKHQQRKHFVQLQELQKHRDAINIEWGQLQLEQSTWATHGRIERLSRQRLGMVNLPQDEIVIIKP